MQSREAEMFRGVIKKIFDKIFDESKSGYDPLRQGYQPKGRTKLNRINPPGGGSGLVKKSEGLPTGRDFDL